jgi:endonuclease/exonuclease/phosphatase family metal-dependent hydrolase
MPDLFQIMSLNVNLAIGAPIVFNSAKKRARLLSSAITNSIHAESVDVIGMQELVTHRGVVLAGLSMHFPNVTEPMRYSYFSHNIRLWPSGLVIASRWPIMEQHQVLFQGVAYHHEHCMAKGVLYARILYQNSTPISVFNMHLQAWDNVTSRSTRIQQCNIFRKFRNSLNIPRGEPIFLTCDANVDICQDASQFELICQKVDLFPVLPDMTHYTFDGKVNVLVGTDDPREYINGKIPQTMIDYIFFNNHINSTMEHIKTTVQQIEVQHPYQMSNGLFAQTTSTRHVTDHASLVASFQMSSRDPTRWTSVVPLRRSIDGHETFDGSEFRWKYFVSVVLLTIIIFMTFLVGLYMLWRLCPDMIRHMTLTR